MKVFINITEENGTLLDRFSLSEDPEYVLAAREPKVLAARVRDILEPQFEIEDVE